VELQKEGLFRSIGVSNFRPEHIERIVGETGVSPAVNQIELNPAHQQQAVREFHQQRVIAIESYSPLGRGAAVANPTIREIAVRHARTPAQAILRWHIQQGLIVIPKTSHPERMRENIAIFDFELDDRDMRDFAEMERPAGR
jgi:2,5-diketo-D-gluconate reductase A